jgi:hypothetical protein
VEVGSEITNICKLSSLHATHAVSILAVLVTSSKFVIPVTEKIQLGFMERHAANK